MQRLEVSDAVRLIYRSLGVKGLSTCLSKRATLNSVTTPGAFYLLGFSFASKNNFFFPNGARYRWKEREEKCEWKYIIIYI